MQKDATPISELAKEFEIEEVSERIELGDVAASMNAITESNLKSQTLPPLVALFIIVNLLLIVLVFVYAAFENHLHWQNQVISDKVVIALISGITVQAAAVIVAAYKGLFASSE